MVYVCFRNAAVACRNEAGRAERHNTIANSRGSCALLYCLFHAKSVMSRFWSPLVSQLKPYVPGEQPKIANLVKLNTNESPYGPGARVLEAIRAATAESLRLYPDPNSDALRAAIAVHHDIPAEQIFVGNGSDEVLAFVFMALLKHPQPLVFPDISYSFYPVYAGLFGIETHVLPLADDFSIPLADIPRANGGIIFPNPNAPTGMLQPLAAIEDLAAQHPDSVVVIDEAYVDFGGDADPASIPTAIPLTQRHPNLLVVQTLSKSRALAGMRIGFAVGHPDLIDALNRVKNSFNSYPLDRLALAAGIASYEDQAHFAQSRRAVMEARQTLSGELAARGYEVLPSAANFVFARHPTRDAEKSALALRRLGVLVRHFRQPRIEQFLRITIGTPEQCAALIAALDTLPASL
jgi:histidinol-phosphate aminotransferase